MGSKGRKNAIARGPPKSAEGRSSGEDKGECFAPFIQKSLIFHKKNEVFPKNGAKYSPSPLPLDRPSADFWGPRAGA